MLHARNSSNWQVFVFRLGFRLGFSSCVFRLGFRMLDTLEVQQQVAGIGV